MGPVRSLESEPTSTNVDATTWESWWELNRIEYFARSDAGRPVETASPDAALLDGKAIEDRVWPHLLKTAKGKNVFVAEAALVALGRVATTEPRRASARGVLLQSLSHRNHLIARCSSIGLRHVADDASIEAMFDAVTKTKLMDVKAFVVLALAALEPEEAAPVLRKLAETAGASREEQELVAAALIGLAMSGGGRDASVYLESYAFEREKVDDKVRAVAVEALGRLTDPTLVAKPLLRALDDPCVEVRRAGAVALGRLAFEASDATELKSVRARLAGVLDDDADAFARRMAAISLGRLAGVGDGGEASVAVLKKTLAEGQVGMREYALLALALAGAPDVVDLATKSLLSANPSTRSAASIALGLAGMRGRKVGRLDAKAVQRADQRLGQVLAEELHPHVRAYAALATGMIGGPSSAGRIKQAMRKAETPEERAYGLLALALTADRDAADEVLKYMRPEMMRNGFVASHAIYALGLTKDRRASVFDALMERATNPSDMYVQAASITALGYLASRERYPQRHLVGAGYSYTLWFDVLDVYFYMI